MLDYLGQKKIVKSKGVKNKVQKNSSNRAKTKNELTHKKFVKSKGVVFDFVPFHLTNFLNSVLTPLELIFL